MAQPFIQKVPPANAPSRTLTLYSYQGGLDNVSSQSTTRNECATNVLNMVYLEDGLIQKRFGTNPYNNTTYPSDVVFFDTFMVEGEAPKLITATTSAVYVDGTKIADVRGEISGATVNMRYMFVDGHDLFCYEKVDNIWKVYNIISPTNLEDELSESAKKGDKHIMVKTPSKFKAGQYIQIGKRKVDNKGLVSDTPPPQTVRVLKVEGSKVTLGEEIKIDGLDVETTSKDEDTTNSKTNAEISDAEDESKVHVITDMSGVDDKDYNTTTTTLSKRKRGTSDSTVTVVRTGVTIVTSKNKKKDEDDIEIKYDRLEFDHPAGTPVIIFPTAEKYKYIGDWKTNEANKTKWYEPCVHELQHAYFGVNVVPPKPTHIVSHRNRVVICAGGEEGHIAYISDTNNPYYYPVSTGITLPATGDKVKGMASFHDSLVFARSQDMHVLYGSSNNPDYGDVYRLQKITTHTGCASGKSMKIVHNFLFYLGNDGVIYRMQTTQTDVRMLQTSVMSKTVDLFKKPLELTHDDFDKATATFTNEYYYLSVGKFVLVYSYRFMAWTVFDRIGAGYMGVINDEVVWAKGNRMFHFDETTFLDDGEDFNCFWESKLFDLDLPVNYKYFKYISLVFDCYEDFDSTAKLIFEIDYEEVTLNHVFQNSVSRWGKAKWGVNRFAKKNISKSLPIYVGRRGRMVKVKVHNGNRITRYVNNPNDLITIVDDIGAIAYARNTRTHHKYIYNPESMLHEWIQLGGEELNQPIKLYNVEIEYSIRGRR